MVKLVKVALSLALVFSFGFSAYADVNDGYVDNNAEDSIVTEYYTQSMLDSYENGDIPTSTTPISSVTIDAKSAILIEQTTGTVIFEKNADEKLSLASITKIMSLILIMEHIESGGMNLHTVVTCSEHAASMGGSQIWLEPNEKMTVNDLLKAVVIGSANDATCALAEAVAGSEEAFVKMMNDKCALLGMNSTVFKNCSGLDADGHYSTARDIAIMSKELLKHERIFDYSTVWMDTLRNGATQLVNTNKLVRFYEGATGLKTGTTNGAGCCVSASAKRNGLHLIAVVMGASSSDERFRSARKLLDVGFANFQFKELKFELKENQIKVIKGTKLKIKLKTPDNVSFLLEKGQEKNIETHFNLPENVIAPINNGDTVGSVVRKLDGKTIATTDIVAAENVEKMNFANAISRIAEYIFKL